VLIRHLTLRYYLRGESLSEQSEPKDLFVCIRVLVSNLALTNRI